ncbi:MAG: hypothetical protein RMM53_08340 [Bacteroidia bacterium]|nr:hypothetical protein [Bacteroidia bacterium]MDW8334207.1 hypothetical protein [Bacteroidia bacterium]
MKILPFDKCTTDMLEAAFRIRRVPIEQLGSDWIQARHPIPDNKKEFLFELAERLFEYRNYWNEMELRTRFIGPVLELVDFSGPGYNSFADRNLKAVVGDVELSGKTDWMTATGKSRPVRPFFFLHEYKKLRIESPDPQGQLLAAMFAAQALNNDRQPVYGCYTVAQYWTFVLLNADRYSVSEGYDASSHEIQIVWSILCETKKRIEQRVQEAGL